MAPSRWLYPLLHLVARALLFAFYRVERRGFVPADGPLLLVGNHPNALVDPTLIFAAVPRRLTFLAKAPLFSIPLLGAAMRAMGALPVYRRQDDPTQMDRNQASLETAAAALADGSAIALFPEGRSHSEPRLGELKTGAARIALQAARRGAPVRVVPVGLTYSDKTRFRSEVLVQFGEPLTATARPEDDGAAVRDFTAELGRALEGVTLNLSQWEDLPLLRTAESLYALGRGEPVGDPARLRAFAQGLERLRRGQPERADALRAELASFQRRLDTAGIEPRALEILYSPSVVTRFVARQVAAVLLGLPFFCLGMLLFALPYRVPPLVLRRLSPEPDMEATLQLATLLVLAPVWWLLLVALAWGAGGPIAAAVMGAGAVPLAFFTRYFYERRRQALADMRTFFVLGSRHRLKAYLAAEAYGWARRLDALAAELEGERAHP